VLVADSNYERAVELLNEGLSQKDVSEELDVNKSTVSRYKKKAENEGRFKKNEDRGSKIGLERAVDHQVASFFP